MVTASRDWAVTWAVIELWPSRDHIEDAVIELWPCSDRLSWYLAVTELWPRRDWAVTSPSCDWAMIIGPGAVTTVVTVSSRWAHNENLFLMGVFKIIRHLYIQARQATMYQSVYIHVA